MAGIFNLSSKNSNIVCDAVADPPRFTNNKILTEIPDVQAPREDQCNKTKPNPLVNDQDTASAKDSTSDETKDFKSSAPKSNEKSKPAKDTSNSINNAPNNGSKKKEFKEMSAQIKELSKSEKEITTEDMLLIKIHLGKWKEVAEKLDLSEGEIEQLYEDYKSLDTTEVVYQMLIKWHQQNSKAATIGRLISAMWSCQAYDCTERLAELHSDR